MCSVALCVFEFVRLRKQDAVFWGLFLGLFLGLFFGLFLGENPFFYFGEADLEVKLNPLPSSPSGLS